MKKKTLAILLAVLCVVGVLTIGVFASTDPTTGESTKTSSELVMGKTVAELEAELARTDYSNAETYPWAVWSKPKGSDTWTFVGAYQLYSNHDDGLPITTNGLNAAYNHASAAGSESYLLLRSDYTSGQTSITVTKNDNTQAIWTDDDFQNIASACGTIHIDINGKNLKLSTIRMFDLNQKRNNDANNALHVNIYGNSDPDNGVEAVIDVSYREFIKGSHNTGIEGTQPKNYYLNFNDITVNMVYAYNMLNFAENVDTTAVNSEAKQDEYGVKKYHGANYYATFNNCTLKTVKNGVLFNSMETDTSGKMEDPALYKLSVTINGGVNEIYNKAPYLMHPSDSITVGKYNGKYPELHVNMVFGAGVVSYYPQAPKEAVNTADGGTAYWAGYSAEFLTNENSSAIISEASTVTNISKRIYRIGTKAYNTSYTSGYEGTDVNSKTPIIEETVAYIPFEYDSDYEGNECAEKPWVVFYKGEVVGAYPYWSTNTVEQNSVLGFLLRCKADGLKNPGDITTDPYPIIDVLLTHDMTIEGDRNPLIFANLIKCQGLLNIDLNGNTFDANGHIIIQNDIKDAGRSLEINFKNGTIKKSERAIINTGITNNKNQLDRINLTVGFTDVTLELTGWASICLTNDYSNATIKDADSNINVNIEMHDCVINSTSTDTIFDFDYTTKLTDTTQTPEIVTKVELDNTKINCPANAVLCDDRDDGVSGITFAQTNDVKVSGMALKLYDEISATYRVDKNAAGENARLLVKADGKTYVLSATEDNGFYVFITPRLAPDYLGEDITVAILADGANGNVCGAEFTKTMADYCYAILSATGFTAADKKLIADTLNYAAAVQAYNGVTTGFVNELLKSNYPTLGTQEADNFVASETAMYTKDTVGTAEITGMTVGFKNGIRLTVNANSGSMKLVVKDSNGNVVETIARSKFKASGTEGEYYIYFTGSSAAQLRKAYTFELYGTDGKLSCTLSNYSFETYAYVQRNNADLKDVLVAMMNYGESAYEYMLAQ